MNTYYTKGFRKFYTCARIWTRENVNCRLGFILLLSFNAGEGAANFRIAGQIPGHRMAKRAAF